MCALRDFFGPLRPAQNLGGLAQEGVAGGGELHDAPGAQEAVSKLSPRALQEIARVEAEINQAADWGKRNGVPLVCNEFGVYRHAQPQDRLAWLADVHTALERHNIGWAMWDYSGSFGVVTKKDGKNTLDADTVKALGLTTH